MKLPLSYLKKYVDHQLTNDKLSQTLTLAGLEVDAIERRQLSFENVVAAKVASCKPHPDAENLQIVSVSDGAQEFQVVCGGANCREGIIVAFARVGALLFKNEEKPLKIKKAKLRGIESLGMLCAKEELGLEEKSDGILELPLDTPLGCPLDELFSEDIMEVSFTPNLGYSASLLGIARELSALLSIPYKKPTFTLEENASAGSTKDHITLKVTDFETCPRYATRLVKGVKVAPSPDWLRQFLEDAGIRSINNVVDVTNFVLLELGQPLHAFDYNLIEGKEIIVRDSKDQEIIQTLDGQVHTLSAGHILICDAKKPIALAGVMGGQQTEVNEATQDVLIEVANFRPQNIRKTSKKVGLQTDASWRFERGCDPQMVPFALDRAASLIAELGEGRVTTGSIDAKNSDFSKRTISCDADYINNRLGTQISLSELESIFKSLEFEIKTEKQKTLHLTVPSYRYDVQAKIDLVEEIARIYGYNHIPRGAPNYSPSPLQDICAHSFSKRLHHFFSGYGLTEFITNDLVNPSAVSKIFGDLFPKSTLVNLLNPGSIDLSMMRPSLLPGMLSCFKQNIAHYERNIRAYEIGKIHFKDDKGFKEQLVASVMITGERFTLDWESKGEKVDFFDIKGITESLLDFCQISNVEFKTSSLSCLHPHRQCNLFINGKEIGVLGEIHPQVVQHFDIPQKIYFAEFNLKFLQTACPDSKTIQFKPLASYPGSDRDWTLLVKESTSIESIQQAFEANKPKNLEGFSLKDIFRGKPIAEKHKSITFNFVYRNKNKTLASEQVEKEHGKFKEKVSEKLSHILVL
jgi:phenylalanyl-tRNA synthetase beta chain